MSRYDWPRAPGADAAAPRKDDPGGRAQHNALRDAGLGLADALRALRRPASAGARPPRLRAPASSDTNLWQPLGPAALLGGQAEGAPRVAGRVNALCVHPDGVRAYAASANGGVWATTDGGAHWQSVGGLAGTDASGITGPAHRNACAALHVIWRDPPAGNEIVFMGTGEPHQLHTGRPGEAERGVGIYVASSPLTGSPDNPWTREAPNLVNDIVYAIASDPSGSTIVAATATGLYQRPAAPGADVDWQPVAGTPFSTTGMVCSAVLWTAGETPAPGVPAAQRRPSRLWVWVQTGANNGLWVRDEGQTNFTQVTVDAANSAFGFGPRRGALAAVAQPSQVWLLIDRGTGNSPGLFRVSNPRPVDGVPQALGVAGVPNILRDSGWYNIALAVDPSNEHRIALAGSFLGDPSVAADLLLVTTLDGATRSYDASIVVDTVVADPADAARLVFGTGPVVNQMIGMGVHPDVHALAYSHNGNTLWAGCDGGIYRSDRPLRPAGFYPRNHGLSISETNHLACSSAFEGDLMSGLQDNGIAGRLSSGAWRIKAVADGGGLVMDPLAPARWLGQYTNGTWSSNAALFAAGPLQRGSWTATGESAASAFYSTPAAIAHTRGLAPAPVMPITQVLLGTNRLWYSDDFGASWVTLPTATDPLPAPVPPPPPAPAPAPPAPAFNAVQDALGEPIYMCRWQDPDTAWVLSATGVHRYDRTPGSHHGGGPGTWAVARVLSKTAPPAPPAPTVPPAPPPGGKAKKAAPAPPPPAPAAPPPDPLAPLRLAPTWTEIEPNWLPPSGAAPGSGALYLGTVGHPTDADVDTLWWFDGNGQWLPTRLRNRGNAGSPLPAPVTAILVDPALPEEVWVGTTVGVVRGVRSAVAAAPPGTPAWEWTWTPMLNGLPEAAVEDLSLYKDGSLRLLRAAIAARGVWELRLDRAAVAPLTYLRVHGGDLRHRDVARLTQPDGSTERTWHASPDIRPRLAPTSAALPLPGAAAWWRGAFGGQTERLRRFQAALRASTGDPRIVGNGVWDGYFSEVLRDHGAPTVNVAAPAPPPAAPALPNQDRVHVDNAFWNTHFQGANRTAEPWGPGTPTEADLLELTPDIPEGSTTEAACTLPARPWKVEIVVHHRGRAPRPGADVRVTLLWWTDPASRNRIAFNEPTRWATLTAAWAPTVAAMLNSADGASAALPAGWHYAGSTNATRRLALNGQTLDPLNAGVASFDLNLTGLRRDRLVLLVAVVRAGADVAIAEMPLRDLTLANPAVAVRAVRIA